MTSLSKFQPTHIDVQISQRVNGKNMKPRRIRWFKIVFKKVIFRSPLKRLRYSGKIVL